MIYERDNILAESESYIISFEFEIVYLDFKTVNKSTVIIGDVYGDPQCALISRDERYCVVGGTGLIVYFLEKPFVPYAYHTLTNQYFEKGREHEDMISVSNLYQEDFEDGCFFRYVVTTHELIEVWRMNVDNRFVELVDIQYTNT